MAFSYSDENFTVVGNLCFVHILLDGTETIYDIPPAISDRMLFDDFYCIYLNFIPSPQFAHFKSGKIKCDGIGYLYCYFPIDSNK